MTIKVLTEPDVYVSAADLERYTTDYKEFCSHLAGSPPTLEDYIKFRQLNERGGK